MSQDICETVVIETEAGPVTINACDLKDTHVIITDEEMQEIKAEAEAEAEAKAKAEAEEEARAENEKREAEAKKDSGKKSAPKAPSSKK